MTRLRALSLAVFAVLLNAGCASPEKIGPMEAPAALTGDMLSAIGGGTVSKRSVDAEAELARRLKRGGAAPLRREPTRPNGFGFDRELHGAKRQSLQQLLDAKPVLQVPGRLACVEIRGQREFVDAPSFGGRTVRAFDHGWTVRPAAPPLLHTVRVALGLERDDTPQAEWPRVGPKAPPFRSIVAVPSLFLPSQGDLGKVRYAAARIGADAILVFARSTRLYTWNNGLANLYLPLFPVAFFLPAKEQVAVTKVEGAIVSVRTGHVFCVAQGEARIEESGSVLFRNQEDMRRMIDQAERSATRLMTGNLASELAALEAAGRFKRAPAPKAATKS